jgi:non-specific serine/threonine protein kinase
MSEHASAPPAAASGDLARRFRFADFELNELTRELRRNGRPLLLESRPFDLLIELLRHPAQVVSKDELIEAVWQGRPVSDGVLTQAVMKLRAVLDDGEQQLVRTVHRHGYRLGVAVLSEIAEPSAPPPEFEPRAGDPVPHRPNFRFERELGAGGFARVWLARHRSIGEPRVFKLSSQSLHMRVLKREIGVWRVLHESLGRRSDIVRLIDWNLEDSPYFLELEYVAGGSLPQWFESAGGAAAIAPATRIALAAQIAATIGDAHAVGVLHKDIKPANILIDAGDTPRAVLTDFGSGLILDPEQLERLRITRIDLTRTREHDSSGSGTVLYLAPELLGGAAPTTRSDIYALGVLLFQLVVGDFRRVLAPGWERDIDDELLREDIALATDGDPTRRLGDAHELARRLGSIDVRRAELAARRASAARAAELAASAERARLRRPWRMGLIGVLALGLVGTATMAWRAAQSAAIARREAAVAAAVNEFVNQDLLAAADPVASGDPDLRVRDAVARAAASAGTRFASQPEIEARVRVTLSRAYRSLALYPDARRQHARAVELERSLRDASLALELAEESIQLARDESQFEVALSELQALAPRLQAQADPESAAYAELEILGPTILIDARRAAEAVLPLERLVPQFERRFGATDMRSLRARTQLARAYFQTSRFAEAEAQQRATLAHYLGLEGEDSVTAGIVRADLAMTLRAAGNLAEALAMHQQVLTQRRRMLGDEHQHTLTAMNEVASTLQDLGRLGEAEATFRSILAVRERRFGDRHQRTRDTLNNLGLVLVLQKRPGEAEPYYRRALEVERELLGPDDLGVLILSHNYAGVLRDTGRLEQAIATYHDVVERADRTLGATRHEPALFRAGLARSLAAAMRYEEADREFVHARRQLAAALGDAHPRIAKLDEMRAGMYEAWGRTLPGALPDRKSTTPAN